MSFERAEAKITVAKLLELAYSKDKDVTVKILAKAGHAKLAVDQDGNATLSGSAGYLTFSGAPALKTIGAKVKNISVSFENRDGMQVGYTASFGLEYLSLSVSGMFDLKQLITSCSGLLCRAARAFDGRHDAYEAELQNIMGR
ncbi:hypothetical protein JLK41_12220 [Ectopseudomonas khazarica]|uniref:hypothetical protein n=1 Tax=Ectopseudomonas khazarica TaxID=2502979 RepID=UPI001AF01FE1|nr:hypothetical protein [Pseudomonas khazarica]QTS88860.1 hypothetical protein JLK41_12220 [Pseudomonas khazarica]